MRKNLLLLIITFLVFLSSFLFALHSVTSQITFGFDQARDAFEASSIWANHHLKIMGPSSDVPGLNHGVLWYYFLAFAYGLFKGSPEGAATFTLCLLYLFIPVIGIIAYKLTNNLRVALISVLLYSFAPLFVAFSYWLSNPTLALFIAPPLLFLIWSYIKKQSLPKAFSIGLFYGLLMQSDFGFVVLLLTVPLYAYFFKLKLKITNLIVFSLGFLAAVSTFVISYIKFHTNVVSIVLSFMTRGAGADFSVSSSLIRLLDSFINLILITFLPFPKLVTLLLLVLIIVITYRKKIFTINDSLVKFLLIWLSGIVLIFVFNHWSISAIFLYGPFIFAGALLFALIINGFTQNRLMQYCVLGVIVVSQVLLISSWNKQYYTPLSIQHGINTIFEQQIINYTYRSAKGKPFVINSITNPLFINTTWAYLYEYYGKRKYNYLPYWGGPDQTGYLGNLPQNPPSDISIRYLIMEPQDGIQPIWKERIISDENKTSDVVEEKKFENYVVQKRIVHQEK